MADSGPVDASEFEATVGSACGADRRDVARQTRSPGDFGTISFGDAQLATSTGPVVAIPAMGLEKAGRFTVDRLLAGVVPSGLPPAHLAVTLSLPPEMGEADLADFWAGIDTAAADHGVGIATGHTARYGGCAFPVIGAGTAIAVGRDDELAGPDGAVEGDRVLISNGPAVAATGVLGHIATADLGADTLATARERLAEVSVVEPARRLASEPVTAMAAAGDGGVDRCLWELAQASGVRVSVHRDRFPQRPGVATVCNALRVDRWAASATGALVVTAAPEDVATVQSTLEAAGVSAAPVGSIGAGSGLTVDGSAVAPRPDPLWSAIGYYGACE